MPLSHVTPRDIFIPGFDPGFRLTAPLPWSWREVPRAEIAVLSLSAYPEQRRMCEGFSRNQRRIRQFSKALEFNNTLAVVDHAAYASRTFWVRGKALMNGNHGMRLRNRLAQKFGAEGQAFDHKLIERIAEVAVLPKMQGPLPLERTLRPGQIRRLPMVLECRNGFNYYHFLTETLCDLCLASEAGLRGPIRIHSGGKKQSAFIMAFIRLLFPELVDQVAFLSGVDARYDQALISYGMQQQYFLCGPAMMPDIDGMVPPSWIWKGRRAERNAYALLTQNGYDRNLRLLRERGRALVTPQMAVDLPRRIWVTRNTKKSTRRPMLNEDKLIRALRPLGFEVICFEDLTPIQQIAHVASAEIIVMAHGAGLANMLFAAPGATVVELSNMQTLQNRFGDFQQHAHAAGCRYLSIACDHNTETPEVVPNINTDGHVGIAISEHAIATLRELLAALCAPQKVRAPAQVAAMLDEAEVTGPLHGLLEAHDTLVRDDPTLLVWRANGRKDAGDEIGLLADLLRSWDLAPDRPKLLERIIRIYHRLQDEKKMKAYMALYAAKFPKDVPELLKACPWLHPLASGHAAPTTGTGKEAGTHSAHEGNST